MDNGRKQASRVLLNLGAYAEGDAGHLDFVRMDGVTILAPLATIMYPMGRVETVVMVGANGLLYSVEVGEDATHAAIQLESDVMASRDFTLTPPQVEEPVESQQPAESPEPVESQRPAPSPEPTQTSTPSPTPRPSGTPAPSSSQSPAPGVSPTAPDEVIPPVVDDTPQPSESSDPNHIAYVPGSTVEIGGGNGQPDTSESPEPSSAVPIESQSGDVQEQEPEQNSLLSTFLRVVVIIMLGVVVLLIVVWTIQASKEGERPEKLVANKARDQPQFGWSRAFAP